MKLTKDQIASIKSVKSSSLKSRVAELLTTTKEPLNKTQIAQLLKVEGARPEHNISSQFTYLRTEGYIIERVNETQYLILATPDGLVPTNAEPFVQRMLK